MHTDEYGISLSREIDVCRRIIRKAEKTLAAMEEKYRLSTEKFIGDFRSGKLNGNNEDYTTWIDAHETLCRWTEKLDEYRQILLSMKI
ncbi:MAG: hypothetical protein OEW04_02335 [Nitrospirota bacterium]|nr:hypothetical protein [Nitrospirota bacterium]